MSGLTPVGFSVTGEVETAVEVTDSGVEEPEAFGNDFSEEQATSIMGNSPIAKNWSFKIRFSQSRASGPDMLTRRVATDPAIQLRLGEFYRRAVFSGDYGFWQPLRPNQIIAIRRSKM